MDTLWLSVIPVIILAALGIAIAFDSDTEKKKKKESRGKKGRRKKQDEEDTRSVPGGCVLKEKATPLLPISPLKIPPPDVQKIEAIPPVNTP